MGYASAGYTIFNPIMRALIASGAPDDTKKTVASLLIKQLQAEDWDTEDESLEEFADDLAIVAAFAENGVRLPTNNIETVQDLINYLSAYSPDAKVYDIDGMSIVDGS